MKKYIIILIGSLALHFSSLAGTISGGGITWKQIGQDSFIITTEVIVDCKIGTISNTPVDIKSTCGSNKYKNQIISTTDLLPVCAGQCTRCDAPSCSFAYGFQLVTMQTLFVSSDLRAKGCCAAKLSWSECCRNKGITTGPQNTDVYFDAELNFCNNFNYNAPEWVRMPQTLFCQGRDYVDVLAVHSPDLKDSLYYELVSPMKDDTAMVKWYGSYYFNKPINFLGFPRSELKFPRGFQFNNLTGALKFRGMKEEFSIIKIKCQIYHDGEYKGYITREIPIQIIKCPDSNPPVLSGINCSDPLKAKNFEIFSCAGEEISFSLCASDRDRDDSLYISYLSELPGAKISINGNGSDTPQLHFSWTPDDSLAGSKTYKFIVTATDRDCPINLSTTQVYTIHVSKNKSNIKLRSKHLGCGVMLLTAKDLSSQGFSSTNWFSQDYNSIGGTKNRYYDTTIMNFNQPGKYPYQFVASDSMGCVFHKNDTLVVPDSFLYIDKIKSDDKVHCMLDTLKLEIRAKNYQTTPEISWKDINTKTTDYSSINYVSNSNVPFVKIPVEVSDGSCLVNDTFTIRYHTISYKRAATDYYACAGNQVTAEAIDFSDKYHDSLNSYSWQQPKGVDLGKGRTHSFGNNGLAYMFLHAADGCTYLDSTNIHIISPNIKALNDTQVCQLNIIDLTKGQNPDTEYEWYINGTSFKNATRYFGKTWVVKNSTTFRAQLTQKINGLTCHGSDSFMVEMNPLPHFKLSYSNALCHNDSALFTSQGTNTMWRFNDSLLSTDSFYFKFDKNDYSTSRPIIIEVKTHNVYGCAKDTALRVSQKITPNAFFTSPDTVYMGQAFHPQNTVLNPDNTTFYWQIGEPQFLSYKANAKPDIIIDSLGQFPIKLRVADVGSGCKDVFTKTVTVVKNVGIQSTEPNLIKLYPNPFSNLLYIECNYLPNRITVFSTEGKQLLSVAHPGLKSPLDMSGYPAGMYLIKVETTNEVRTLQAQLR
ncbi:T9SS type A sorting domain-containing protein [bacterium]|nr:T9SS type A sorting domain-containing protein [bacterium]